MSIGDPASDRHAPNATDGPTAEVAIGEETVLPLIEETARIERRAVETGRVRVSTRTETIDQILRETLRSDKVGVTRVPINRTLADGEDPPLVRTEVASPSSPSWKRSSSSRSGWCSGKRCTSAELRRVRMSRFQSRCACSAP